jgi:uncharacterized protein YjbI with pentapeptide repeats
MERVIARKANFAGSVFRYARLPECDLSGAVLIGCDMSIADLRGVFHKANLARADLRGANLANADLSEADLTGANLAKALTGGLKLHGAKVEGAINAAGQRMHNFGRAPVRSSASKKWWQFWG